MEKKEFLELEKEKQDYIKNVYQARADYIALLMGGLKTWKMMDDEEEKKLKKIMTKLDDYWNYLIDVLEYKN